MLKTSIPAEEFYNVYTATIHELYTDSFIKQNHLEPSNLTSFKKAMSRKAGISLENRDDKAYTPADLENIVNDANAKYEEYATGGYTQELRKRGEGRYVLFSTLFYAVLIRLGYPKIAEKLKYTEKKEVEEKDTQTVVEPTKEEEGKELKAKIELLEACEEKIDEKLDSKTDKKELEELRDKLEEVIKSAKEYNQAFNDSKLQKLIDRGDWQVDKIKSIIAGEDTNVSADDIQKLKDHFEGKNEEEDTVKKENPFEKKSTVNIESMIPEVLEAIPKFLQRGQEAVKENEELKAEIEKLKAENTDLATKLEEAGKQAALPTDEEELVKLAKEVINKIEDKGKLKDVGMIIMMKAL